MPILPLGTGKLPAVSTKGVEERKKMTVVGYNPIMKMEAKLVKTHLKEQYNEAKKHKDKEGMAYWEGAIRGVDDMLKRTLEVVGKDIPPYYRKH
jgi:hypothetical protein